MQSLTVTGIRKLGLTACSVLQSFRHIFESRLVHNITALYAVQMTNYLLPLVTVPYLARVLGPEVWGLVAFVQSLGQYLALIVEYGFNLSATREVARFRDSLERRAELLASVTGAKVVLSLPVLGTAFIVSHLIPTLREHPEILWAGIFWALATAFNLVWYFQGLEQMQLITTLDLGVKTLTLVGILTIVRQPDDGWKVLGLMGTSAAISALTAFILAYREVPLRTPTWEQIIQVLRLGWSMFVFRGAVSLYTVGNTFILGLFVPPQMVGYYTGAERISKASIGLLTPINQALYPRLSHLIHKSRDNAHTLIKISVGVMGLGGVLLGITIFIFAPTIVDTLLGDGYGQTVPALRILSFLPPLIALSNALGIQWMLSLGLDKPFSVIVLCAGLLNIALAILLIPHYAHLGMAWAVVISELFVTGSVYLLLRFRDLDPFTNKLAK